MKVVFCLALLCCFVIEGLGVCPSLVFCYDLTSCALQNPEVIKARVKSDPEPFPMLSKKGAAQLRYRIKTKRSYRTGNVFKYLVVPELCNWNLEKGTVYIFCGHEFDGYTKHLKIGLLRGYHQKKENLPASVLKFLRELGDE